MNKLNKLIVYIHGKGGNANESEHYKELFPHCDVVGLDYQAQTPWEAKQEFPALINLVCKNYDTVTLLANSIGAYFSMSSLQNKIERAFFVSPIVNMGRLICDMMLWANVQEPELKEKKVIETSFGETLSWDYLCYVRDNPIKWNIPTDILYGEKDSLTPYGVISDFASKHGTSLTVMPDGEHWFHTEEQMRFLDHWLVSLL